MSIYGWNATASGNWKHAANWTPAGGPPNSADVATISVAGSDYVITVNSADSADSLSLTSSDATVKVVGPSALLAVAGLFSMSEGTLNIATVATPLGVLSVGGGIALSGGTLSVNTGGVLELLGALVQTGGVFKLAGGTVSGGTIDSTGGAFTVRSGTLSGVTVEGALNLSTGGASVHLVNGATVVGSSETEPGVINVTGKGAAIYLDGAETVSDTTINLDNAGGNETYLRSFDASNAGGQILTLAASTVVNVSRNAEIQSSAADGDGIVNYGLIQQTGSVSGGLEISGDDFTNAGTLSDSEHGSPLQIASTTFTDSGALSVSNYGSIIISSSAFVTTSSSTITVGTGSSLNVEVDAATAWTNFGTIFLDDDAELDAGGQTSAASLGTIVNSGGSVVIAGDYDNAGETLDGSAAFGPLDVSGGVITGGVVTSAGLGPDLNNATLSDVTYEGPLNLTGSYQTLHLNGGTTVSGLPGSGPGVINITGANATLYIDQTQTLTDETINIGENAFPYDTGYLYAARGAAASPETLTLAATTAVNITGAANIILGEYDTIANDGLIQETGSGFGYLEIIGGQFTNAGTISEADVEGQIYIESAVFSNSGTIDSSHANAIFIQATNFTNLSGNTLTGGNYNVDAGGDIEIDGNYLITTLAANVTLVGTNSNFYTVTSNAVETTIDSSLRTIAAKGDLSLLGGRSWTLGSSDAVSNYGTLTLGGGTLTATASGATLTNAAGSNLVGFGTVTASTFLNAGTIEATDETLELNAAVTGTGSEMIGAATLEIGAVGSVGSGQTVSFAASGGELELLNPNAFSAAIDNFNLGGFTSDTIVTNWSFVSVALNGTSSANVTLGEDGATTTLDLVGNFQNGTFSQATSGGYTTIGFG